MLKVLIADDESKVCQLIVNLIDWNSLGMQVAAIAENGIEALDKMKEIHPDIAIVDIRMPGYDGLELVHLARNHIPKCEFVIVSGYRYFEYAQTAIQQGVSAYLLKPIRKDELTEILTKLGERCRENKAKLSYEEKMKQTMKNDEENLRQTFLQDMIFRHGRENKNVSLDSINQEYHYTLTAGLFCMGIIKFDGNLFNQINDIHLLADKVRISLGRLLSEYTYDYEMTVIDSALYVFLNYDEKQKSQVRKQMKLVLDEVRVQMDVLDDCTVTMSLGDACHELRNLRQSLKHAVILIEERLIAGTGKLLEGEISTRKSFTESDLFAEFNKNMSQALESLDVFVVRETMMQLKRNMLSEQGITGHEILQMTKEVCNLYLFFMKNYRLWIEEDFLEDYSKKAENCASAEELFNYLIRVITISYDEAARQKRQNETRPIRLAKQYIEEHFAEPLTLEQISAVSELSPSYLSTVFKKDTGMTFLEYLTKVRMDMAKQLLKNTSFTVADICEKVGYSDVRYFTKSFKKYSGLKPNEYRKLYS